MASAARFSFQDSPSWRKPDQHLLGSDFVVVEPKTKWDNFPTQVKFDLESNRSFLFGPMTKFNLTGSFEKKETEAGLWSSLVAGDEENVMLAPNWLEMLTKEVAVFHGDYKICTSNEAQHISPHLNTFLLANMEKLPKSLLCPQPESPGYCVPTKNTAWNFDSQEWKEYGKLIFSQESINFDYTFLHVFPFYQNAEHLVNGNLPYAIPLPALGKLEVVITFKDDQDCIFKSKTANDGVKYRFCLRKLQLCIEEARLSSAYEKSLYSSKRVLPYHGVTKIMQAEHISPSSLYHSITFPKIPAPEGLFIFALPKDVIGGTWKFDSVTDGKIFKPLNIHELSVAYNNDSYAHKEPNMGMVENNFMEIKSFIDHLTKPPFGMPLDPEKISLALLKSGGVNSIYPHIYINLCNFADQSRLVPVNQDASVLSKEANFDISVKFGTGGATDGVMYFFYLFYTDVNLMLDMKTKSFQSPYLIKY